MVGEVDGAGTVFKGAKETAKGAGAGGLIGAALGFAAGVGLVAAAAYTKNPALLAEGGNLATMGGLTALVGAGGAVLGGAAAGIKSYAQDLKADPSNVNLNLDLQNIKVNGQGMSSVKNLPKGMVANAVPAGLTGGVDASEAGHGGVPKKSGIVAQV